MDPLIKEIKTGISGFSEAISLADDLDGVAKQVAELGKKELSARAAWRRKQVQVDGDYAFVNAVDEYRRVREALDLKEQLRRETIRRWGAGAWDEVLAIEARQKDDYRKIYNEDGHDRKKLFLVKVYCFSAAAFIVFLMWLSGTIRELSEAFYGG
jgi:hypothetical protein